MRKTAFIGHRWIFNQDTRQRLTEVIRAEIQSGCNFFAMGTHGEFDKMTLSVCRELRNAFPQIVIEVVITSLRSIKKSSDDDFMPYDDVKTVMYDIESTHFKRRITLSNRQMIDDCDTLVCFVDENYCNSGAKTAMLYARKKGLKIINIYPKTN